MPVKIRVSLHFVLLALCAAAYSSAASAAPRSATVYYSLATKGWTSARIHHNASGAWTPVPGTAMSSACAGWMVATINYDDAVSATFQAVFTNGSGQWDNPTGGGNYVVGAGISVVSAGRLMANASNPCDTPGNTAAVYYRLPAGWTSANIHYQITGGQWTPVPGVAMNETACTGWTKKTISLGAATGLRAAFNNGSTWDNNGGADYSLGVGLTTVNNRVVTGNAADPCVTDPDRTPPSVPQNVSAAASGTSITVSWSASTDNAGGTGVASYSITRTGGTQGTVTTSSTTTSFTSTNLTPATTYSYVVQAVDGAGNQSAASSPPAQATTPLVGGTNAAIYYENISNWSPVNIHYAIGTGAWTPVPGTSMNETACAGWTLKTIDLGTATSLRAAFNNGSAWDNNGGNNYTIGAGTTTVSRGVVTPNATNPCIPDTEAPTVPLNLTAAVSQFRATTIVLSWTASTDNRAVTGYEITRTGGTQGRTVLNATTNSHTDSGLSPETTYTYVVKAYDRAGNRSADSDSASATTGTAPPLPPPGTPLGHDPREDTIYFVMTARFFDGDPTNNRGGSQHVRAGNSTNNDPMFRGDFKGLIQKLDYIKGLGFSAIWITPVILNRSDYDFHGYHGWDFFRVDPRLESDGASYQDLINAAHAKGIKIFQDVVYNHTSRWGAKGLYETKVFGVRDAQWSWYYDAPVPGFEYDGLSIDPNTGKSWYNGDLWSTTQPAGNTCPRWGQPNGFFSPEGYRIYNCQWPSPTAQMFPANLYHQCWIGNWEGEDSRSCWLHEDLADLNTENATVQKYLIDAYNRFVDMGVDGFRVDTAVHVPRVTWNRRLLPPLYQRSVEKFGERGRNFFVFGEVAAFVNDKWNRGSVNHSAQFFTWKERQTYTQDDVQAALDQYNYENTQGTANQPTSNNAFLAGNSYHAPDHSKFSGMNVIDMRMHMNFGDAANAFWNGKDSDDSYNDATYNVVYVDSHDFGPNKSTVAYNGGTAAWAENFSLMWTFRGIPNILQGAEIEWQAGNPIDCGPSCPLATTRRAYYGTNLEGSVVSGDFGVVQSASGAVAATLEKPLAKHVQRLNQIRRAIPALQKGQYSTADITGNAMAYKRRYTDAASGVDSFALITVSGTATFANIPNGTYADAITGAVQVVSNGTLTAAVSGQGNLRIYVLSLPGNPAPGKIGADGPFLKP